MSDRNPYDQAPSREPIYRLIRGLMAADVAVGLVLGVVGEFVLNQRSIALAGLGLAIVGVLMLLVFQRLAERAGRRS